MTTQDAVDNQDTDVEELVESYNVENEQAFKQFFEELCAVFSGFADKQNFANHENKDMAMAVGRMLGKAYANFVVAFVLSPWVPDLLCAIGALKAGIDEVMRSALEQQEATSLDDLENVSHNLM